MGWPQVPNIAGGWNAQPTHSGFTWHQGRGGLTAGGMSRGFGNLFNTGGMAGATQNFGSNMQGKTADLAVQQQPWQPAQMGAASSYMDTGYLDQLRGMAAGDDRWEQSQRNLATSQAEAARQGLTRQGMSGMATAQGNLGMRGGLTSGAAERIGQQNLQSQIAGQQDVNRQLADQQLAIGGAADQRQRALLGQLGDAELAYGKFGAGIDQYNVGQQNQAARNEILASAIGRQNVSPGQQGLLSQLLNPLGSLI